MAEEERFNFVQRALGLDQEELGPLGEGLKEQTKKLGPLLGKALGSQRATGPLGRVLREFLGQDPLTPTERLATTFSRPVMIPGFEEKASVRPPPSGTPGVSTFSRPVMIPGFEEKASVRPPPSGTPGVPPLGAPDAPPLPKPRRDLPVQGPAEPTYVDRVNAILQQISPEAREKAIQESQQLGTSALLGGVLKNLGQAVAGRPVEGALQQLLEKRREQAGADFDKRQAALLNALTLRTQAAELDRAEAERSPDSPLARVLRPLVRRLGVSEEDAAKMSAAQLLTAKQALEEKGMSVAEALAVARFKRDIRKDEAAKTFKIPSGIPSLPESLPAGKKLQANTAEDAKALKAAGTFVSGAMKAIDRLIEIREKYGREVLPSKIKAEAASLRNQLITDYNRERAQLGALSGGDLGILEQIIPDVTAVFSRDAAIISSLKTAKASIQDWYGNLLTQNTTGLVVDGGGDSTITAAGVLD